MLRGRSRRPGKIATAIRGARSTLFALSLRHPPSQDTIFSRKIERMQPPNTPPLSSIPPRYGVDPTTSFQRHQRLNLPPCYVFSASDEELLQLFLQPFVEGIQITCPIHTIVDVYSSTPEVLTSRYEQGTADREWFFFGMEKYPRPESNEDRVIDGGAWVKKGFTKRVSGVDGKFLGFKRTQDFYGQGLDHADWRMEEFQLSAVSKSGHILAKIFPVPCNEKKRSKSGSFQSTSPKEKQNQTLESLPHQQTETHQSRTADEAFIYTLEHREWMRDYFPDHSNQK